MANGACVLEHKLASGDVSWRIKFTDHAGKQVMRVVGRASAGVTRRTAERALGAALADVQEGWANAKRRTFATFAAEWLDVYLPAQRLKASTVADYRNTLNRHAVPFLGDLPIGTIGTRELDAYVAAKVEQGLSGKTIQNQLRTLHQVFDRARRWGWIHTNPLADFEGPKVEQPETLILHEAEVAALLKAFKQLAFSAKPAEGVWFDVVGRMTAVALTTALRRGELIGLRWEDVELLNRRLHVRHSVWRGQETTPKSRASRRTLGFGLRTKAALEEQFSRSRFTKDRDLVFGHPDLGTPLDPAKITRSYLRPAMAKAGITKPGAWHLLRHTSLTATAAVTVPAAVQARAGHSSYAMTQRYVHMAQVAHQDATIEQAETRLLGVDPAVDLGR